MSGLVSAHRGLIEDSSNDLANFVTSESAMKFAVEEDIGFISGSGVNRPRGITTYDAVLNASWEWGKIGYTKTGVAATIFDGSNNGIDATISLVYSLAPEYRALGASFIMSSATAAIYRGLKGIGTGPERYLWEESGQAGQPPRLLGYDVAVDDNWPGVGANAFPVGFGAWGVGYSIVDQGNMSILRDPFTDKPNVRFYCRKRVGGAMTDFAAIKLMKCEA